MKRRITEYFRLLNHISLFSLSLHLQTSDCFLQRHWRRSTGVTRWRSEYKTCPLWKRPPTNNPRNLGIGKVDRRLWRSANMPDIRARPTWVNDTWYIYIYIYMTYMCEFLTRHVIYLWVSDRWYTLSILHFKLMISLNEIFELMTSDNIFTILNRNSYFCSSPIIFFVSEFRVLYTLQPYYNSVIYCTNSAIPR